MKVASVVRTYGKATAVLLASGTAKSDFNDGRVMLLLHPITKT